jgi:DNA processing protein
VSAASPAPFGPGALERLARGLGLPPAGIPAVVEAALAAADRLLDQAARLGLGLVGLTDPQYPPWLRQIVDPPPVLWLKGRAPVLSLPAVAVVGSRDATPTGLAVARRLAGGLADAGLTVVSGMARGIDGAAHAGALDAGGRTVAVLGCGVDIAYPRSHEALAAETAASGAVASELPPGTPPLPGHFPLRNRIISGLARAVVIVEASERSGSLITARLALEQGRDVLAVPGGVASGRHRGCHALIKDGARLVETVEDILDEIRWRPQAERRSGQPAYADNTFTMSDIEAIMAVGEPYGLDDLAARTGRPAAELLAELGRLEVAGRIGRFGPGCFVRLDGSAMDRG